MPVDPGERELLAQLLGVTVVRLDVEEQTDNLSLPTQLRACEEYCRRQGYEVLERFHEGCGVTPTPKRVTEVERADRGTVRSMF